MRLTGLILLCGVVLSPPAVPLRAQEPPAKPPVVQHDLAGRDQCLMCHAVGVMAPVPDVPASHTDRPNGACLWCHAADAAVQRVSPPPISHAIEGRETCLLCHRPGVMEAVPDVPADHEGRAEQFCTLCHSAGPRP